MMDTRDLLKILSENPDLPILCMVDGELVADERCARWAACVGSAEVKEYITMEEEWIFGQSVFFKDDADEMADMMCECEPEETYEQAHKAAEEKVANMGWIKAIVLYIDLPEE